MRFWDSSAIVPLLLTEPRTASVESAHRRDPELAVWWGTVTECVSAVSRHERSGDLMPEAAFRALENLDALAVSWHEIEPTGRVREIANRLLRSHPLRTGDALQLAAAIVAAEERPPGLSLVTLDDRLADAARREGFPIEVPSRA